MKIITFPFAGGNKYSFNFLKQNLSQREDYLEVIEYPGRGKRIQETFLNNIEDIVTDFLPKIERLTENNEYYIYGHSMGALVGYLICREIEKLNLKLPVKLVVSGLKSPVFSREKMLSNLPNEDFWNEVTKLGGISEEIKNHPELIEYFAPILKADFKCIENYQYDKNSLKLSIPIDVFFGSDEDITQEEAEAWQEETTASVKVKELKGNHFFIFDHKDFFAEYFKNLQLNATI